MFNKFTYKNCTQYYLFIHKLLAHNMTYNKCVVSDFIGFLTLKRLISFKYFSYTIDLDTYLIIIV